MTDDLLPPLATTDYLSLRASIAHDLANGRAKVTVILDERTGEVIDGNHRLRICQELGIEPEYQRIAYATEHDAERAKVLLNLSRRHMTVEQRRELEAKLLLRGWTQQEVAEAMGVTQGRVSQDITNININNGYNPDQRVKLTPAQRQEVVRRVQKGETQAQVAADYGITQPAIVKILAKTEREELVQKERERLTNLIVTDTDLPEGIALWQGDFRELEAKIPENSVSLIFTDPPYAEEFIPLYGDLARLGERILQPGGSLICYAGHYALPEIFPLMTPYLRFWWVIALRHSETRRLPGKWVEACWKPLLWFVKDHRANNNFFRDLISPPGPEKSLHDWQQSITEARYCIETLTDPGELILDPMAGSGTTIIAALLSGRKGLGIEKDEKTFNIMRGRVKEHADRSEY